MPFLQRISFAIGCVQVDKAASLLAEQMNNYIVTYRFKINGSIQ